MGLKLFNLLMGREDRCKLSYRNYITIRFFMGDRFSLITSETAIKNPKTLLSPLAGRFRTEFNLKS